MTYRDEESGSIQAGFALLGLALGLALLLMIVTGCAGHPIELSGGIGPHATAKFGSDRPTLDASIAEPAPGVAIIAAGEGVSINANVQVGTMQSVTSSVTNQTPVSFLDKVFGGGGPPKVEDPKSPVK